MNRKRSDFKDTQLLEWKSESSVRRQTTFFYPDELTPVEERQPRIHTRGLDLVVVVGVAICTGLVVLGPLLRQFFA